MAASDENFKFRSALNGFHRSDVIHFLEQNAQQHDKMVKDLNSQINTLKADLLHANTTLDAQRSDMAAQESALSEQRSAMDAESAKLDARQTQLRSELDAMQALNDSLNAQCDELTNQVSELKDQVSTLQAQCADAVQKSDGLRNERNRLLQEQKILTERLEQRALENHDLTTRLAALSEQIETLSAANAATQELAAYRRAEAAERNAYIRAKYVYHHVADVEANLQSAAFGCVERSSELQESLNGTVKQLTSLINGLCAALQDAGAQLENTVPGVNGNE